MMIKIRVWALDVEITFVVSLFFVSVLFVSFIVY